MAFVQACSLCSLHGVGTFYFIFIYRLMIFFRSWVSGCTLNFYLCSSMHNSGDFSILIGWQSRFLPSTFILFWFGVFEGHPLFHFHHTVSLYEIPHSFGDLHDGGDSVPARSFGTVQSDILRPARLGVIEWGALLLPVCLLHCFSLWLQWTYPYVSFTVPVSEWTGVISGDV
jgi:hypothetical protein